jgi:hypothetical protein
VRLKRGLPGSKKRCPPRRHQPSLIEEGRVARVIIGMDPHKRSATIEAIDDRERVLA